MDLLSRLPGLIGLTAENSGVWAAFFGALAILVAIPLGVWQIRATLLPLIAAKRTRRKLAHSFGADSFEEEEIFDAIRYYIEPDCSQLDPASEEDIRHIASVRESVFQAVDRFLRSGHAEKHLLLLADSGMGKTSFLLNYYDRNRRPPAARRFRIVVLALGRPNAVQQIQQIKAQKDTILFLDAFDEDPDAIRDHKSRLQELMEVCANFKRVVLTCRTQFFHSDEEIPKEPGIAIVTPRKVGQARQYRFFKLYLLPLSEEQVDAYLRKRFPFWHGRRRAAARKVIASIPELSVRPMLLAVVPDLIEQQRTVTELFELYEFMVESWLERESSWIQKERLRGLSEVLAVDVFLNRERRGFERIPRNELMRLIEVSASDLEKWRLTARSLLNRDAVGNYKFAHRSIMEYLFVVALLKGNRQCLSVEWTDLMKQLFVSWGRARASECEEALLSTLRDSDFQMTGLVPLGALEREPASLNREVILDSGQERFVGVGYTEVAALWRALVRGARINDIVVICDRAGDLVWLLPYWQLLSTQSEMSLYRMRRVELKTLSWTSGAPGGLLRRSWRAPTLGEFDTLRAVNASLSEEEQVLAETEFYWTGDFVVGGGQLVVSVGSAPIEDGRVKYIGGRRASQSEGVENGYHVYEVLGDWRHAAGEHDFRAQLARVSRGGAEDAWHSLRT